MSPEIIQRLTHSTVTEAGPFTTESSCCIWGNWTGQVLTSIPAPKSKPALVSLSSRVSRFLIGSLVLAPLMVSLGLLIYLAGLMADSY